MFGQRITLSPIIIIIICIIVATATQLCSADPTIKPADLIRVRAEEQARIELIQNLSPTVACIFDRGKQQGGGSGVVIDADGYGLTNYHVVASMLQSRLGDAGMDDKQLHPIEILGIDPTGDVAMFRLTQDGPHAFAKLGDSDQLQVGDYTLAMGNPFLLAEDFTPTVTYGIVSGVHRYQWGQGRALRYTDCIQVDTSINPGNSGGPLFNMYGHLVGINGRVSIEERGRVNVGVGYAISINQIKRFLPALRAGLSTQHAAAGFTVRDEADAVIVNQILDDSPAYLAGLRLRDQVLSFNGTALHSANHFVSLLGAYPAHWPITITMRRKDATAEMRFRLETLPLPELSDEDDDFDPYKEHLITRRANQLAVRRIFGLWHSFLGGAEVVSAIHSIKSNAQRSLASRPGEPPKKIAFNENRPANLGGFEPLAPADIETRLRWTLLDPQVDPVEAGWKVTGGDAVVGRIAVVLRRDWGPITLEIAFDDADGRLLRIAFTDPASRRSLRFEYDDYLKSGSTQCFGLRYLYESERFFAVDQFKKWNTSSRTQATDVKTVP